MKTNILSSIDYEELLLQAVAVLDNTRTNIARSLAYAVNSAYWELGKILYERKIDSIHGANVVNRLSSDLKQRYPSMGFSPRQLWNMKKFYLRFHESDPKLLQAVAVLPWGHILKLITDSSTKNNDDAIRYYVNEIVEKGWSRELLTNAIKLKMYESRIHSVRDNNFEATLPAPQALYANEVLKSSYNLGFLGATSPLLEMELEQRLVEKVKFFLLELGNGFTYIGNQYPIEYKGSSGIIDLLFFHRGLKCLIAIELKAGK